MSHSEIRTTERFEHSTLPMALLALDGEILQVNRALLRLVGLSAEGLVGVRARDLGTSAADRTAAEDALVEARASGRGGDFVQTWRNAEDPDGKDIHVRLAWSLMRTPEGAPWYISVICVDESQRVEAERQRARESARFRARFEQSSVPQALCDLEGRFADANEAFCALVGRARAAVRGQPIGALNHHTDLGEADEALKRLISGDLPSYQKERVLRGVGGRPVSVLVTATLIRDEAGAPESAAAYFQDISLLRSVESKRQQQEDFFLALSARASDLAIVTSAEGDLLYVSPSVTIMLGYGIEDVLGSSGWSFVHPDDEPAAREVFERVLATGSTETVDIRVRASSGEWRVMEETMSNLLDTPVGGIVANLRDITEKRHAEAAMRASDSRLRTIVDTAEEGIWAARFDGSTLYMNLRMAVILGIDREQMHERSAEIWSRFSVEGLRKRIALAARPERFEVDFAHPDGRNRILSIATSPLHDEHGEAEGSLAMVSDVTDARRLESELRHAAMHDSLTGLPNRALLVDRLEHALARSAGRTAVLFIDLDHFKVVNDSRGHAAGDELLVAVSARLVKALRPEDTVARFGGDEFVVVCEEVDEDAARELAEEVLAALEVPFDLFDAAVHVSASLGLALSPAPSAGDLLRFADAAMYSAKSAGRRRVRVFDPALAEDVEQRYLLQADLHDALSQDTLALHYQPVVDLASGRVVGLEALARWTHPTHGEVPPTRFVPIAEETGLAADLDRWAVRRALREVAHLRDVGAFPLDAHVAVNLSAGHLAEIGLVNLISTAAADADLPPEQVVLEITETSLVDDLDVTIPVLKQLRALGFQVAVDDFGTGYSSLGYLRDLPITTLKIDRSFVNGIVEDSDALAIVASVVDLAKAIGLGVVAEGVETQEQADLLLRLGCASAQGWLWSAAISPEQAIAGGGLLGPFPGARKPQGTTVSRRRGLWSGHEVSSEHGLDRMLELHRAGASLATIAAVLNREGFASPHGARWNRAGVARTVSSVAYPQLDVEA
ncbi:MAG: diguanylate cyclase/phosphodiesterase with sensor(s) [Frankiales bacterium]|nr:diguanylate cyclase/phosphodiesterase with sensor(s) [Frankiales bacterium]